MALLTNTTNGDSFSLLKQAKPSSAHSKDRKAKLISADVILIDYISNQEQDASLLRDYVAWKKSSGLYEDMNISEVSLHQGHL